MSVVMLNTNENVDTGRIRRWPSVDEPATAKVVASRPPVWMTFNITDVVSAARLVAMTRDDYVRAACDEVEGESGRYGTFQPQPMRLAVVLVDEHDQAQVVLSGGALAAERVLEAPEMVLMFLADADLALRKAFVFVDVRELDAMESAVNAALAAHPEPLNVECGVLSPVSQR